MTLLEQLEIEPETVRALRSQYIHSVEDLLALAAQPDERAALLEDMQWTGPGLDALVARVRRRLEARRASRH